MNKDGECFVLGNKCDKEKSEAPTGTQTHDLPSTGAGARCLGSHGFHSCRGLRFLFVPCSCHVLGINSAFKYRVILHLNAEGDPY